MKQTKYSFKEKYSKLDWIIVPLQIIICSPIFLFMLLVSWFHDLGKKPETKREKERRQAGYGPGI